MRTRRIGRTLLVLFPLAIVSSSFHAGCGDDSRKTGTQLKLSEEAKAQINDMRSMYKETKAQAKKKK
jgi:hypothetical protein